MSTTAAPEARTPPSASMTAEPTVTSLVSHETNKLARSSAR
ncbi:MAG TPA: hypothetical protein VFU01_17915 [Gemmatimonadaceae bacterium]|nr:hypothetical protein [Gemmatimonadaceae bacterium]